MARGGRNPTTSTRMNIYAILIMGNEFLIASFPSFFFFAGVTMREKKGGALQKLKKRLSHSFGRLCKYESFFYATFLLSPSNIFVLSDLCSVYF